MTLIRHAARALTAGFFAILVPLSAGVAQLPVPEGEGAKLATRLLEQTYTRDLIEGWRRVLLTPGALPACQCGADIEAKMRSAWQAAVDDAFDVEGIYSGIRQTFAESFTADELERMVAFRDTPLGRKISDLERPPAAEPDAQAALDEIANMRKVLAADPGRRSVLEELTAALGGVEAQVDLLINVSLGASLGAQAAIREGQPRMTAEETIALVELHRAPMLRGMDPIVLNWYAAIYQSLTLEELKQYRDVVASELGQKSVRVGIGNFNQLMRAQSLAIGARFATELAMQDM